MSATFDGVPSVPDANGSRMPDGPTAGICALTQLVSTETTSFTSRGSRCFLNSASGSPQEKSFAMGHWKKGVLESQKVARPALPEVIHGFL